MKKVIYGLLFTFLLLTSCKMLRKVDKVDQEKKLTQVENTTKNSDETTERKTVITEEGGRIQTDLIPLNERYDELTGLYKELKQTFTDGGLTKTIYYRPDGSTQVDCSAADRLIEMFETINKKQSETNDLFLERLEKLETKKVENETETKGININIMLIAAMAFIFLYFFKKF